jgi:methionyl-tRNA formyltransferase
MEAALSSGVRMSGIDDRDSVKVIMLGSGPGFDRVLAALSRAAGIHVVAAWNGYDTGDSPTESRLEGVHWLSSIDEVASHDTDLCFACEYHRLLPADFVQTHTVLNSHGGLLPKYRGFHGLGWAFINGEAELGYTIHRVDSTLDGGPIIYQGRFPIRDGATFSEFKAQLLDDLVEKLPYVLRAYVDGELPEMPQDIRQATFVGRRHLRDCFVDWTRSSVQIERFVRALSPPAAPGAFTVFRDEKLVILSTELYPTEPYDEIPGHVVYRLEDRGVLVKTGDGVLLVKDVEYRGESVRALDLFPRPGFRLGIDLVGERLRSLGIV